MKPRTKAERELQWWQQELYRIVAWYHGLIPTLWGRESPGEHPPVNFFTAITAFRLADRTRYADLLQVPPGVYYRVLDIGSGPLCPATWFGGNIFSVEPLARQFIEIGYPMDQWGSVLIPQPAENLWMLPDSGFDLVVSNNAMDHVDDFEAVCAEIDRLATPDATIRLNICCRKEPTLSEPQVIDDARVLAAFPEWRRKKLLRLHEQGPEHARDVLWGI